jgi:FeS assembly SUF system regulator
MHLDVVWFCPHKEDDFGPNLAAQMLRISKLTDYAIVVMAHLATDRTGVGGVSTARDLARRSGLPGPTVSKLLKELARSDLVQSQRGLMGGYRLARDADSISVADIVRAVEGPIALTECNRVADEGSCDYAGACPVEENWSKINGAIFGALSAISLSEMARSTEPKLVTLSLKRPEAQAANMPPERGVPGAK